MNSPLTKRTIGVISAAMLLGATAALASTQAYSADLAQTRTSTSALVVAQNNPQPSTDQTAPAQKQMKPMHKSHVERVQDRIKSLHDQLKITAAQEPQWSKVAQVMTDNAQKMSDLEKARHAAAPTATAVDDLKAYQAIVDAHAAGLKDLIPAWTDLYNSLSDDQKKTADAMFRHRPRHAMHEHKNG